MGRSLWKAIVPILVVVVIALIPPPEGLSPDAWRYFALFAAVVVGLILEPIPAAAIGLLGVTLAAALLLVQPPQTTTLKAHAGRAGVATTYDAPKGSAAVNPVAATGGDVVKTATPPVPSPGQPRPTTATAEKPKGLTPSDAIRWALSGFANATVWLIFVAYMLAMGYEKTGLGRRLGLVLVKLLGKSTLGLGYAVAVSDLILSPFTPSNTARSGGTIFPIIKNIPPLFGSTPDDNPRKIGSYLMWTAIATTCVTSSLFLTGLAPNLLALTLVQKTANVSIAWTEWFLGFLPIGAILFFSVPLLTYLLYPPSMKTSEDAHRWAGEELKKMGKTSRNERLMAGLAVLALLLWIFGGKYLDATTVALVVLSLMLLTGIVKWEDVTGNRQAWNVLVWFGTLVTLADGLSKVGFLKWISDAAARSLLGVPVIMMMILLTVFFFAAHYMFASITAHTTALLPVLLATAMSVPGVPVKPMAMLLCFSLGIMGVITPYATGPSPIYYGSGYISRTAYWSLGLVFGIYYLAVLLLIGVPYMKILYP